MTVASNIQPGGQVSERKVQGQGRRHQYEIRNGHDGIGEEGSTRMGHQRMEVLSVVFGAHVDDGAGHRDDEVPDSRDEQRHGTDLVKRPPRGIDTIMALGLDIVRPDFNTH